MFHLHLIQGTPMPPEQLAEVLRNHERIIARLDAIIETHTAALDKQEVKTESLVERMQKVETAVAVNKTKLATIIATVSILVSGLFSVGASYFK